MKEFGYKEVVEYLQGNISKEEMIEKIKMESRRYAKRQITWFKRYENSKWFDLDKYDEIVFCGYGEPLVRINEVVEVAKYIRSISDIKIRVNTNGLSDLMHKKKTAVLLKDNIDAVSISLNAPNKTRYNEVTQPKFGEKSFEALLDFATDCKKYIKEVNFSVVDEINEQEIKESQELADKMNIPLRVRHKN